MGYKVLNSADRMRETYSARKGLEGPFHYPNGQVLYYDPKEGAYYDPSTDFYVSDEDVAGLQDLILAKLA